MKVISYITLLFSLSLSAHIDTLSTMKIIAHTLYNLGDDNNHIDSSIIDSSDGNNLPMKALIATQDIMSGIKECVFMKKGAYGPHLSDTMQDKISHEFNKFIQKEPRLLTFKITNPQIEFGSGIFNAPCIFAIKDPHSGKTLLLSSAAED
ncbi:MAG: hypothetical protein KC505_08040 [Myxococcales bacterium]|nr:hypothetical protein [Myxococcales bacterium]USN50391.1 MAG: hypothetical protein H6731_09025 [Myxococcales bacterium]